MQVRETQKTGLLCFFFEKPKDGAYWSQRIVLKLLGVYADIL